MPARTNRQTGNIFPPIFAPSPFSLFGPSRSPVVPLCWLFRVASATSKFSDGRERPSEGEDSIQTSTVPRRRRRRVVKIRGEVPRELFARVCVCVCIARSTRRVVVALNWILLARDVSDETGDDCACERRTSPHHNPSARNGKCLRPRARLPRFISRKSVLTQPG